MTSDFQIRDYKESDRSYCIDLFNSNCPEYFDAEELSGFEKWLDGQGASTPCYANSEADHYYVVEHQREIIGCGGFYLMKGMQTANMAWGMIRKSNHKEGAGKQFFQFRLSEIERLYPQHAIILDTSQHTVGFYEKFGFQTQNVTPNGYGEGLDRYNMVKT